MSEETAPMQAPPFEGTRQELDEHLRAFHMRPYYLTTKTVKAELTKWHDRWHDDMKSLNPQIKNEAARTTKINHIHTAVSIEDIKSAGGTPLKLDKPLTTSEASALKTLIDNDFDALTNEMKQLASDNIRSRVEELDREWKLKEKVAVNYNTKLEKLFTTYNSAVQDLVARAKEEGVKLPARLVNTTWEVATLIGRDEAVTAVRNEVQNDLSRALLSLQRQRIAAQRTVILARVTPEAAVVLDSIPDARALMTKAAQERSAALAVAS